MKYTLWRELVGQTVWPKAVKTLSELSESYVLKVAEISEVWEPSLYEAGTTYAYTVYIVASIQYWRLRYTHESTLTLGRKQIAVKRLLLGAHLKNYMHIYVSTYK